jgi:hypothetical protein
VSFLGTVVGGVDGEVPLRKKSTFKGNGVALGSEGGYETIKQVFLLLCTVD